jgi:hypothetical protein
VQSIQEAVGPSEKISTEKGEEKAGGVGEGDKTSTSGQDKTDAGESDKTSTGDGNKTSTGTGDNTGSAGEETKQEELPPWWGSLPLYKKILYPTLAISLVSFITELVYASTLRSTIPYKKAIHILRCVDEIEEAFGEIKEPKWYRFWEVTYGYWWVQASGYEGISKLWIPIVGVKEYKTDQVDKNGEPVMRKVFTRGRAYVEAKKEGAGQTEWALTYLMAKGEKLGMVTAQDEEWLDVSKEGIPKPTKGQMVLVDRHVQVEGA